MNNNKFSVAGITENTLPLWDSGLCQRWHTNPELSKTNDCLAGHHGRVAQIILKNHPDPSINLIRAALTHDAGEYLAGDLPYDFKIQCPEIAKQHSLYEAVARDTVAGPFPDLTDIENTWLKWADRMDAYLWASHHGADMTKHDWIAAQDEINRLGEALAAEGEK